MSRYEQIADAVIEKKPEFADVREQIVEEIEMLDGLADELMGSIDEMRPQIPAALSTQPPPDASIREQTNSSFAFWGISIDKFGAFFGVGGAENVYKLVAMTLMRQGNSTVEKEAMKTFIIASLRPEMDVLAAA
jgi:hypothetical protein